MKKRLFALLLALILLLPTALTAGALSDTVFVCRLRGVSYTSMADALKAYEEGDVLELLVEVHRCSLTECREIRVRGVDGVQVPDDLFFVFLPNVLQHRVEGDIHIFTVTTLAWDPSWPEVTMEPGTVPYAHVQVNGSFVWPGETARVDVSPDPGCEVVSVTVLDARGHEIPTWRAEDFDTATSVSYQFILPTENLPVTAYATVRPAGWTDGDCPGAVFEDVPADAWYHMAVDELARRKAVNGRTPTRFDPYGTLNRAEAVTILYRLLNSPEAAYEPVYSDVPEGKWYTAPVLWATGERIVGGVGGGRFNSDGVLTREELWTMLLRLSGDKTSDTGGLDAELAIEAGELSDWAAGAFLWAREAGLYDGSPVHGKAPMTRAEAAVTVYLYLLNREKPIL